MAVSTCIKCGNHTFEMVEVSPQESKFKLNFIQCVSCGGVVGVQDFYNIGNFVKNIADKLGIS